MIRELLKDLQSMKGAVIHNYDTFPIVYGEKKNQVGLSLFVNLNRVSNRNPVQFPRVKLYEVLFLYCFHCFLFFRYLFMEIIRT